MIFSKLRSGRFSEELWYGRHKAVWLLIPISWIYWIIVSLRHLAFASGLLPVRRVAIPVMVVGNITVGGTGKTPLIIWLTGYLKAQGYRPGIISRGYGGAGDRKPQQVRPDSNPALVGDEPVLIARRTNVPVAVATDRYVAAHELTQHTDCNILLCDDGLQHYSLHRDIEIAVVDGDRQFGNGHCLPAGPLREPESRLNSVDMVVGNGKAGKNQYLMEYQTLQLRQVGDTGVQRDIASFSGQQVHAVAGLGNPNRFFASLRAGNISIIKHVFPDHHLFRPEELEFHDGLPVLITEKDAVKCLEFDNDNLWYLPIQVRMPDSFEYRLKTLLKELSNG